MFSVKHGRVLAALLLVLLDRELPGPDCDPARTRNLGGDLVDTHTPVFEDAVTKQSRHVTQAGVGQRPQTSRLCNRSKSRRPMQSRYTRSELRRTATAECMQIRAAGLIRCQPNKAQSAGGAR